MRRPELTPGGAIALNGNGQYSSKFGVSFFSIKLIIYFAERNACVKMLRDVITTLEQLTEECEMNYNLLPP